MVLLLTLIFAVAGITLLILNRILDTPRGMRFDNYLAELINRFKPIPSKDFPKLCMAIFTPVGIYFAVQFAQDEAYPDDIRYYTRILLILAAVFIIIFLSGFWWLHNFSGMARDT